MDDAKQTDVAAPVELPIVLWIGTTDGPEFAAVFQWLQTHAQLAAALTSEAAWHCLAADGTEPELIVLAESSPGEFPAADISRLRQRLPLARVCELLGSWCEGMASFSEPLGGVIRLPWHQWIARMAPEFAQRATGQAPTWSLPVTATDDERLLALMPEPRPRDRGLLAVHTRQGELARTICDACPNRGWAGIGSAAGGPIYRAFGPSSGTFPCASDDWAADPLELRAAVRADRGVGELSAR